MGKGGASSVMVDATPRDKGYFFFFRPLHYLHFSGRSALQHDDVPAK